MTEEAKKNKEVRMFRADKVMLQVVEYKVLKLTDATITFEKPIENTMNQFLEKGATKLTQPLKLTERIYSNNVSWFVDRDGAIEFLIQWLQYDADNAKTRWQQKLDKLHDFLKKEGKGIYECGD